uniref:SHSP domain-containing protein n=1 Tax=Gasterosteus aculeatus aculeatus TaxID=481459 RepID=A0AAQ4PWY0_GASAC
MGEHDEAESSCGALGGGGPPRPPSKWRQSSSLFNQDVGTPPFLEPAEPRWTDVERLQRGLAGCPWPGFTPAPLFVPYICGPVHRPGQQSSREPYKWRVSLEVAHFLPSEISLSVRDGFLEVGGKHEERPDEHGFIARCFTRKYRLPAEIDVTKIASVLSVDGVLTVEAPVPKTSVPSPTIIPIKVNTVGSQAHLPKCQTIPLNWTV